MIGHLHHYPDLSLASTYIPGCLSLLKCSLAFAAFCLAPIKGWIGLCCLLIVDRILWNNNGGQWWIMDVNAVSCTLVGGLMISHDRTTAIHMPIANIAVEAAWALVSALQVTGVTRMPRSYEVLLSACAVTVLSCLHSQHERIELMALRAFVFVMANTILPYLAVMLQQHDGDTSVNNICRTLLIMLGEPEAAAAWTVVYMLCVGYQVKNGKEGASSSKRCMAMMMESAYQQQQSCAQSQGGGGTDQSDAEAQALLREALARRTQ